MQPTTTSPPPTRLAFLKRKEPITGFLVFLWFLVALGVAVTAGGLYGAAVLIFH